MKPEKSLNEQKLPVAIFELYKCQKAYQFSPESMERLKGYVAFTSSTNEDTFETY
jgi:hypothetical protein